MDKKSDLLRSIPDDLRTGLEAQLQVGEEVLACFAPDLDPTLRFRLGLIVVTSQRLLAADVVTGMSERAAATPDGLGNRAQPSTSDDSPATARGTYRWQSWPLSEDLTLKEKEHGRIGTLELIGPAGRMAYWRYTVGRAAAARRFSQRCADVIQGQPEELEETEDLDAAEESSAAAGARLLALFRLWRFAKHHVWMILLGFLLTMTMTAAELVPPYLTMPLLDNVLIPYQNEVKTVQAQAKAQLGGQDPALRELQARHQSRFALVPWYLAGLAGAAIAACALSCAQGWVSNGVSERISVDLRNAIYSHLMKLSIEFFGDKRTGDLISRISSDTDRVCYFLSETVVDFLNDTLTIVGTAAILTSIDPVLGVTTFCTFPLIGWMIFWVRNHLATGVSRAYRAWDVMTSILADTIPGMRVVKAFAQESRELDRFRRSNESILRANTRVNTVWSFFWPLVSFLNQMGLLVIWALGTYRVFDHQITVGVLTAFLAYIGRFYARLESMTRMFSSVQRAATSSHRMFEVLDRVPSVREPAQPVQPGRVRGRIEFRNVSFQYGNRTVIKDLDLVIQPGEMLGVVGPSGAGKTTLVNLLCRFYDVSEGAILVDGVDIRSFPIAEYRRNIGIVLQEPFLFFGTIADNISYGRPTATRLELINAARAARAHDFILQRPLCYDDLVGERGQQLSGGERQRISIARAILIDPRILILDEATSSVDTETEREIQRALDNLVQGRTTVAIAHRLSTLLRADRLIVLERGRIVEMGRHDELLRQGGVYARLYHAQWEDEDH